MWCKVESPGVCVGNQWLSQVRSPRSLRRIDAGERKEDEAAHDHRNDPADDHDESLVDSENDPQFDFNVQSQNLFSHRLLSGPTAQKQATVIRPPAANSIPM